MPVADASTDESPRARDRGANDTSTVESPSCAVCNADATAVLCDAEEIRAQLAWLSGFHRRRLATASRGALEDRAEFTHGFVTNVVTCRGCGLVFRDPRPSAAAIEAAYAHDHYGKERLAALFVAQRELYARKIRVLRRWLPTRGELAVVEIGSFVGGFLAAAASEGWTAVGIDPGEEVTRFCRSHGLRVVRGTIEDASLAEESVDCVAIWNTFDQLPDPTETLTAISRVLRRGGVVAVRVPNGLFFRAAIQRLHRWPRPLAGRLLAVLAWNNLAGFPYLYGYSLPTLDRLLARVDLARVDVEPDTLVRLSDDATHAWASVEERLLKLACRATWNVARMLGRPDYETAPWLDLYYKRC